MTFSQLAPAIVKTVAYTNQFQYPLTAEEIWQRLVLSKKNSLLVSRPIFDKTLATLVQKKTILKKNNYFFLPNGEGLVAVRKQRERWSTQKQTSVQSFVRLIRWIPWVKAVAITGSLAVDNARRESDIDYLIVTSSQRLWLTRLITTSLTTILGKRRRWHYEDADSWCLNLWIDDQHLSLPQNKRSLYSAYEACQAAWVYDVENIQENFYVANSWVEEHLPFFWKAKVEEVALRIPKLPEPFTAAPLLRLFTHWVLTLLNFAAYIVQKTYMSPRITRELVELGQAYFHPRDTRRLVYTQWEDALRQGHQSPPITPKHY